MSETITSNIASHLAVMAETQPYRPAVIFPHGRDAQGRVSYTHYTFRQLNEVSNQIACGLEQIGLTRGTKTALMVPPSLDFFALTFALFKLGAVPVLIDPGIGVKSLGQGLAEAAPAAFIGIPKAHAARTLLGWARKSVSIKVTVGKQALFGGLTLEEVKTRGQNGSFSPCVPQPGEMAAILFTSGSTGPSKGVVYTHEFFSGQVEQLKRLYGIQPGEMDLPTFPLFALFGPALGMTAVLPDMDPTRPAQVDPVKIIEAIENFGITNMFGSPALINRVGRYGEANKVKLSSLKRVISAGAPVPAKVLKRFADLLPEGSQVFTPYGATECLPVSSIGSNELLNETRVHTEQGKGVCVGLPVPELTVKVVKITDEPIPCWSDDLECPRGTVGEIVVKGAHVTSTYYNRPEATRLAKIAELSGGGFYHRMGDLGYIDERGRIWFCGRKSHRVSTAEGNFFTIPCEAVFNTHPMVFRTAVVGVERNGKIEPVLCVELEVEGKRVPEEKMRGELLELGRKYAHTRLIQTILFHPAFPVDIRHNAKIFREKLAVWASNKLK